MSIETNSTHPLWEERYRPKLLKDCILPDSLRQQFEGIVKTGTIPHMILSGGAGRGKTTVAKALCNELKYDVLFINGSDEGRFIDTLRNKVQQFASTVSLYADRKVVLVDEADNMGQDPQSALRAFIEKFSASCSFIFTCNYKQKIMAPLSESRFTTIDFNFPKKEEEQLMFQMFKRVKTILKENNVAFDQASVISFIGEKYPDFRSILVNLQSYFNRGPIDAGILLHSGSVEVDTAVGFMKKKDFKSMRSWVAEQTPDFHSFNSLLYQSANKYVDKKSIPTLVMLLNQFQTTYPNAVDKELFMAACLTTLMAEIEWLP